jgi:23S rRNA pseudouridine955/2504/2580 synthase
MKELSKDSAVWHEVEADSGGQRLDNYLTRILKGVPRSHVYRIVRSGEVRVNSSRVSPDYRVQPGDRLRIPPVRVAQRPAVPAGPVARRFDEHILYEDDELLALDKPAGIAVHGGSGVSCGVIEQLRRERPQARRLELVHRLDRDTSGVLLLAKKRSALTALHAQLRAGQVQKFYAALVHGRWRNRRQNVSLALRKHVLKSGERRVSVDEAGMPAQTVFRLQRTWKDFSLLEAELKTGRTHQIRVHLAHLGFPIAGDDKYGDFALNRALGKAGLKRMFLHACRLVVTHPVTGKPVVFEAPIPDELSTFLRRLDAPGTVGADVSGQSRRSAGPR